MRHRSNVLRAEVFPPSVRENVLQGYTVRFPRLLRFLFAALRLHINATEPLQSVCLHSNLVDIGQINCSVAARVHRHRRSSNV
uniref:Uncharacterized protein n=1 Tax=Steinernema glaseri TaxID=37863 RepID=A0A1I7Z0L5_9BILA